MVEPLTPTQISELMAKTFANIQRYKTVPAAGMPTIQNRGPEDVASEIKGYWTAGVRKPDLESMAASIYNLAKSGGQVLSPQNRVYLTKNADDPFDGDLQQALDFVGQQSPAADNRWVIEILSPGDYTGNFTFPSEYISIVSLSGGPLSPVRLISDAGNTLEMPQANCLLMGLSIISNSPNTGDAALYITPSLPGSEGSIVFQCVSDVTAGATALRVGPGVSDLLVSLASGYAGISTDQLVHLQSGGFISLMGFVTGDAPASSIIKAETGTFAVLVSSITSGPSGGTGWLFDADGGSIFPMAAVIYFEAANIARGRNGATLGLFDLAGFTNPSGTRLDLDLTSVALIDHFVGSPGSSDPFTGFVVADPNNVVFVPDYMFSQGLDAARPATPKAGMTYYATDRAAGSRQLLFVPGIGWVDQGDNVV